MTTITIIGLRYVGLPLAVALEMNGFDVFGYDTNEERVKEVGEGKYPFSVDTSFDLIPLKTTTNLSVCLPKMGVNTFDVIKAASTKPFGFMPFYPGPGVGGHCILIDPFYLSWNAKQYGVNTEFIELAAKLNQIMLRHIVELIEQNINKKQKILILGVAYKKNVSNVRNTPAKPIIKKLLENGWDVKYFNPYVKEFERLTSEENLENVIEGSNGIVLITDHDYFRGIKDLRGKIMIDTRKFFNKVGEKLIGVGK